jgi:hypothetical protein
MSEWKLYKKTALQEMRPFVQGEDLFNQCITINDRNRPPCVGGMIARGDDPSDQWYISPEFFKANYELAGDAGTKCPEEVKGDGGKVGGQ